MRISSRQAESSQATRAVIPYFRLKWNERGIQPDSQKIVKAWKVKKRKSDVVAERVGFEPTVGVNLHTLSKRAP